MAAYTCGNDAISASSRLLGGLVRVFVHAFLELLFDASASVLELADTLAYATHQLRNFLGTEEEQKGKNEDENLASTHGGQEG